MTSRRAASALERPDRKGPFQGSRRQRALAWFLAVILLVSSLGVLFTLFAK